MAYLSTQQVQPWLEKTKLTISTIDPMLDLYVKDQTLGRLSNRFTTTSWVDYSTTPSIVLQAMGLLYAAIIFQREYSEDIDGAGANWGTKLEAMWASLVDGLASGAIDIIGIDESLVTGSSPSFYPTDAQEDDDSGEERQFSMGKVF